ncbi:MAG TPA: type II CAAX endopeptidase family protein [Candidatus Aquilonibacter sp.]|nr:type II CAAX endopeptidase family protein [Candidatus Aquilonibacter sp.]
MSSDFSPVPPRQLDEGSPEFLSEPPHFSHPRIPEDIRVPWDLWDIVLLVLVVLVATFFIGLVVVGIFVVSGVRMAAIEQSGRDQALVSIVAQALIDLAILGYLALQIGVRFREPFWQTIGWRKLDPGIIPRWVAYCGLVFAGAVVAILVNTASNVHPPKGNLPIDAVYQDRLSTLLFLLMAVLLAPLVEETVFRGYIYPAIAKAWGVVVSIFVTGALFGLLHGFQLGGAMWQIALLVMVGIIFTWVRASARTVVASYCMHVGYNSFLLVGFLASTHLLRSMPPH